MAVGGLPEKILTAFQSVLDEHSTEEAALSKCSGSVRHVGKIEEDVENNIIQGKSSTLVFDVFYMQLPCRMKLLLPYLT